MYNKNGYSNRNQKCSSDDYQPDISVCIETQNTLEYSSDPYLAIRQTIDPYSGKKVRCSEEPQQLEFSSLYDSIKENTKEKNTMSYVGVLRSDKGLVAFSDSRSTYVDHGKQALESDDVKKVFTANIFCLLPMALTRYITNREKQNG